MPKTNSLLPRIFAGEKAIYLAKQESPDHGSVDEQEQPRNARMNILTYQPR